METLFGANFRIRNCAIAAIESLGIRDTHSSSYQYTYRQEGVDKALGVEIKTVLGSVPGLYEIVLKQAQWTFIWRYKIGSHYMIVVSLLADDAMTPAVIPPASLQLAALQRAVDTALASNPTIATHNAGVSA